MFLVSRFSIYDKEISCSCFLFKTREEAEEYISNLYEYEYNIKEIFPDGQEIYIGKIDIDCYGDVNIDVYMND